MSSLIINNKTVEGIGQPFASVNPANQEVLWQGQGASADQVEQAILSAKKAFESWALLSFNQRSSILEKYINILTEHKEDYANALHLENGKPLWEARTEVAGMIAKYQGSINAYNSRTGTVDNKSEVSNMLTHRPIGVMVVFGPFNFPGHLPNGHIIPALLAGNTVVFKPSELTPMCGELLVKYMLQAGLPDGVLNLVQGGVDTGRALIDSKNINGVLFTGSYKVGKIIHEALSGRPEVMLALEMGGNNPLIVDTNITDITAAVYHTVQSAFITSGQRCTCARRLYIPDNALGNEFLNKFIEVTSNLALSDGINHINCDSNDQAFMGPVASLASKRNILEFSSNLVVSRGAVQLVESKSISNDSALVTPGIYLLPELNLPGSSLFSGLDTECFGPVVQVYKYDNLSNAIRAANNTQYGLSAGLFSDSRDSFDLFYKLIRAGIVNWNRPTTGAAGSLPFGGIGHSGNYRPSAFYAADYCAYPMATQYTDSLSLPSDLTPGVVL